MNQADLIVTRIERARQDRSISVAELARRIDVGRKRLWYVLNGQHSMHVAEFNVSFRLLVHHRCFSIVLKKILQVSSKEEDMPTTTIDHFF